MDQSEQESVRPWAVTEMPEARPEAGDDFEYRHRWVVATEAGKIVAAQLTQADADAIASRANA